MKAIIGGMRSGNWFSRLSNFRPENGAPSCSRLSPIGSYSGRLKGHFPLNKGDRDAVAETASYFEQAIAADPKFAQAYSALGLAYTVFGRASAAISRVTEALPNALAAARKALELDPTLAEAHMVLAYALEQDWRWDEAEAEYGAPFNLRQTTRSHCGISANWWSSACALRKVSGLPGALGNLTR